MESLIETFHIDIKLLVAQIVNFGIVFLALYFFALKPLAKVMQERTKKIEKSLEEAKEIEKKLANTEEDYSNKMSEAKKEANIIIEKAKNQAENKREELLKKAKEEIGAIIEQEKAKMQTEKAKTLKEIKADIADLVVASVEKILGKNLSSQDDKEIVKKVIK
ncbi:MAG: F0F1 ATP synthase subunit B [Patescibacteria group bacterium]